MKVNKRWEELKEESHANIQSERGILNRQIRSIQTEGHFGDIKENDDFRRFNYRTSEKVYKEFMLYAISRNLNKYHRFIHGKLMKFEGNPSRKVHRIRAHNKNGTQGLLCPKISETKRKKYILRRIECFTNTNFRRIYFFWKVRSKIGINR